jgi:sugar/nucleoside kinase (ribokinase family)
MIAAGTLTLDTIEQPGSVHYDVPGGSALYAAAAARPLMPVHIVGTVGRDFPVETLQPLWADGVDHSSIDVVDGNTFRWHARYDETGDVRTTISRDPGVAAERLPHVNWNPSTPYTLMLGSTDPQVQNHVIRSLPGAQIVGLDSMAHWWKEKPALLHQLLPHSHVVFVDEAELVLAASVSGISAGMQKLLELGPDVVIVKRGSRGACMARRGQPALSTTAAMLTHTADPTGAGDAFAGALIAALAVRSHSGDEYALRFATAVASFAVETIGTLGLQHIELRAVEQRMASLVVTRVTDGYAAH